MGLSTSGRHSPYQAHHIIPVQLRNHPIFRHFDFYLDDATNGVFLRNCSGSLSPMARHQSNHPGYSAAIDSVLTKIANSGMNAQQMQSAVGKLQNDLRRLLENGTPLRPSAGGSEDLWARKLAALGW